MGVFFGIVFCIVLLVMETTQINGGWRYRRPYDSTSDDSDSSSEVKTKCDLTCNGSWGYTETDGPKCWSDCFPLCKGKSQSPIDLRSGIAVPAQIGASLQLTNGYTVPRDMTLLNNGHVVSVDLIGNYTASGIALPEEYMAFTFHFHWGSNSSHGSEHYIDGRQYPMELHVVHYSVNFAGPGEAISEPRGLAVLGFMFTISPVDNPAYDQIINALKDIPYKDDEQPIANIKLLDLLPEDLDSFYRYDGSLTTPECQESVLWTVFTETIDISEAQLETFRSGLYVSKQGDPEVAMIDNYRPPLPLGNRELKFYSVQ